MFFDFTQANIMSLFFQPFIFSIFLIIFLICRPDDLFQGCYYLFLGNLPRTHHYLAKLNPPGSLYDNMVSTLQFIVTSVEIIDLPGPAETHSYYCIHMSTSPS